jgi:hypothetical protein
MFEQEKTILLTPVTPTLIKLDALEPAGVPRNFQDEIILSLQSLMCTLLFLYRIA